jgi:hypothetical protein
VGRALRDPSRRSQSDLLRTSDKLRDRHRYRPFDKLRDRPFDKLGDRLRDRELSDD